MIVVSKDKGQWMGFSHARTGLATQLPEKQTRGHFTGLKSPLSVLYTVRSLSTNNQKSCKLGYTTDNIVGSKISVEFSKFMVSWTDQFSSFKLRSYCHITEVACNKGNWTKSNTCKLGNPLLCWRQEYRPISGASLWLHTDRPIRWPIRFKLGFFCFLTRMQVETSNSTMYACAHTITVHFAFRCCSYAWIKHHSQID